MVTTYGQGCDQRSITQSQWPNLLLDTFCKQWRSGRIQRHSPIDALVRLAR